MRIHGYKSPFLHCDYNRLTLNPFISRSPIKTNKLFSVSCPAIPWFQLLSSLSRVHESLDMVHIRRVAEPAPNQTQITNCLELWKCSFHFCIKKNKITTPTSSKTKKGAIRKAWTRLSNRAGARFCKECFKK